MSDKSSGVRIFGQRRVMAGLMQADAGLMATAVAANPQYHLGDAGYDVAMDLNRDGVINNTDQNLFNGWNPRASLGAGQISNPGGADNDIGFDGWY